MTIPNYNPIIKPLDCEISYIYETRDLLSGKVEYHNRPYEIVVSACATMGERGFYISLYYDELPGEKQLFNELWQELKDWLKDVENTYYDEQRAKIIKKVLRKTKKFDLICV